MERHHPQTRVRAWVFTTQNTLPAFEGLCRGRFPSENNVTYAKWQRESGDRTHQDHIQGYVIFKNPVSKPSLCFASHWEPRKGSHTQADTYVEKVDTRVDGPWMVGIPPQQGARNDLATLKEDIDKEKDYLNISDEDFNMWNQHLKSPSLWDELELERASMRMRRCQGHIGSLTECGGMAMTEKRRLSLTNFTDGYHTPPCYALWTDINIESNTKEDQQTGTPKT